MCLMIDGIPLNLLKNNYQFEVCCIGNIVYVFDKTPICLNEKKNSLNRKCRICVDSVYICKKCKDIENVSKYYDM